MRHLDRHRRKVIATAAAVFTIGVAFAAQPTADQGVRGPEKVQRIAPWVPGADMLMSAHESPGGGMAAPR
jgi:hypothetical protein